MNKRQRKKRLKRDLPKRLDKLVEVMLEDFIQFGRFGHMDEYCRMLGELDRKMFTYLGVPEALLWDNIPRYASSASLLLPLPQPNDQGDECQPQDI